MADGVKFVRIRGRIVPIRAKKAGSEPAAAPLAAKVAVAGGAVTYAGGHKLQNVASSIHHADAAKLPGASKRAFIKSYGQSLKAAKLNSDKIHFDPFAKREYSIISGIKAPKLSSSLTGRFLHINSSQGGEASALHELGHILSSTRKGSANYALRSDAAALLKTTRRIVRQGGIKNNAIAAALVTKGVAKKIVAPFATLGSEWEASKEAFKIAQAAHGPAYAQKIGARLGPAYFTYVGAAVKRAGALAVVGGAAAYGIHKLRGRKKQE